MPSFDSAPDFDSAEDTALLGTILELARRLCPADAHAIWRKNGDGNWRIAADRGLSASYPRRVPHDGAALPAGVMCFPDVQREPAATGRTAAYAAEGVRSLVAVPLTILGEHTATITCYYRTSHGYDAAEIEAAVALADLASRALSAALLGAEQSRLRSLSDEAHQRAAFLAEASKLLSSSLDYETTLNHVARLAVPKLADWCTIDLVDAAGVPRPVAVAHADPAKLEWARSVRDKIPYNPRASTGLPHVLRTGKSELYAHVPDELLAQRLPDPEALAVVRELGLSSLVIVPLMARDQVVGALTLISAESGFHYDEKTVELAEDLGRRAGTAIDNARLLQEIQRSEAKLRRLVDSNLIGVMFADRTGRVTDANSAFLEMVGYTAEDLSQGRIQQSALFPAGDGRPSPEPDGTVPPGEMELRRQDGSHTPVLIRSAEVLNGSGETLAVALDLTARKQAEENLRYAMEHAHCLLWQAQVEPPQQPGQPQRWNWKPFDREAARRFLPLEIGPSENFQEAFERHVPADDLLRRDQNARTALDEERTDFAQEFRCVDRTGSVHWLYEVIHLEKAGADRWRAVGVCTDITERRLLEERTERLAAIVTSSDDAIVSKTLDGVVTSWNQAAERIFGYTAREMIGQPITLLIPADRPDEEPSILERISRGEHVEHFETVRRRKDGRLIDVSVTISPVRGPAGQIIGASKIARDITLQKALQRELRERVEALALADRRKDEFLAMLAHELRNPLTPIGIAARIIARVGGDNPVLLKQQALIERKVTQMARILDDLLDVSRITQGKITLRTDKIDLVEVVAHAADGCRTAGDTRSSRLVLDLPQQPVWVLGDALRLEQVLSNLLLNAMKFTAADGRIEVKLSRQDTTVQITVRDSGVGIAPDFLPSIFDLFAQSDCSLDRSQGGLGIGLTLVKRLVELHGGDVEARSEGLGHGSEFRVRLPLLDHGRHAPRETIAGGQLADKGGAER